MSALPLLDVDISLAQISRHHQSSMPIIPWMDYGTTLSRAFRLD